MFRKIFSARITSIIDSLCVSGEGELRPPRCQSPHATTGSYTDNLK